MDVPRADFKRVSKLDRASQSAEVYQDRDKLFEELQVAGLRLDEPLDEEVDNFKCNVRQQAGFRFSDLNFILFSN